MLSKEELLKPRYKPTVELFWWEERKVEDMPEYIKVGCVVRRFKGMYDEIRFELYDNKGEVEYEESIYKKMDGKGYELYFKEECEPSDETEYLTFINKIKDANL